MTLKKCKAAGPKTKRSQEKKIETPSVWFLLSAEIIYSLVIVIVVVIVIDINMVIIIVTVIVLIIVISIM